MTTRFRAYKLDTAGSSFSYFNGKSFILGEARLTNANQSGIDKELFECGMSGITILHITSWDMDHCNYKDLEKIILNYSPKKIDTPKYHPHTNNGKKCQELINSYPNTLHNKSVIISERQVSKLGVPDHINIGYEEPERKKSNDNSAILQLRSGTFSVFTLGDVENKQIARRIIKNKIEASDVLLLPHHGANNGFVNIEFLNKVNPKFIICCVNKNNRYNHPSSQIIKLIKNCHIPLYTTQENDVLIIKEENTHDFQVLLV